MTLLSDLKALDELFDSPEKWTKGAFARGKAGGKVDPNGRYAVTWCITGAAIKITDDDSQRTENMLDAIGVGPGNNDHPSTTFPMIKQTIQEAIERES